MQNIEHGIETSQNESTYTSEKQISKDIIIDYDFGTLHEELKKIVNEQNCDINVYYPKDYLISFDEYAIIQEILKDNKFNTSLIKLKI